MYLNLIGNNIKSVNDIFSIEIVIRNITISTKIWYIKSFSCNCETYIIIGTKVKRE